jgi:hypothetical protein
MKKIVLFLYVLNSSITFSQPTFSNRYLLSSHSARAIVPSIDGGYFFSGYYNFDAILGKIDSVGNLVWAKQIGEIFLRDFPVGIAGLDNGDVAIAMYADSGSGSSGITIVHLISFDNDGNLLFNKKWINSFGTPYAYPNNLISYDNKYVLTVGDNSPLDCTHILRVDSAGNIEKNIYVQNWLFKIFRKRNGSYLMYNYLQGRLMPYLDSDLNYQGCYYADPGSSFASVKGMTELSDSSFLIYGGDLAGEIGKLRYQNGILRYDWHKGYGITSPNSLQISGAQKINSNSIMLLARDDSRGIFPVIFKIDTMGNVREAKELPFFDHDGFFNFPTQTIFKNNRYTFLINELFPPIPFSSPVAFHIQTVDTNFYPLCNLRDTIFSGASGNVYATTSYTLTHGVIQDSLIDDNTTIVDITFQYGDCHDSTLVVTDIFLQMEIHTYPNPTNGYFTITFNNLSSITSQLQITDLTGRIMHEQTITNQNSETINLSLPAGIYFVQVRDGEKVDTQKLIVE